MPVAYQNTSLYEVTEVVNALREQLGKNPTVKIIRQHGGLWEIQVHDGIGPNSKFLGYIYDGKTNVPAVFLHAAEAFTEVCRVQSRLDIVDWDY